MRTITHQKAQEIARQFAATLSTPLGQFSQGATPTKTALVSAIDDQLEVAHYPDSDRENLAKLRRYVIIRL